MAAMFFVIVDSEDEADTFTVTRAYRPTGLLATFPWIGGRWHDWDQDGPPRPFLARVPAWRGSGGNPLLRRSLGHFL